MDGVLYRLLQLSYLMLPAYAANMAPPFVKYWRGWNRPIAPRHLGSHKTIVGFVAGVCAGVGTAFAQSGIAWSAALVGQYDWLAIGLRLGIGAMAGDSAKSFAKRRLGIPPGAPWVPFDQLDFVAGALLLLAHRVPLSIVDYGLIVAVSAGGHIAVNHVAYGLGIRDTRW